MPILPLPVAGIQVFFIQKQKSLALISLGMHYKKMMTENRSKKS
jgi:hypothetical protein